MKIDIKHLIFIACLLGYYGCLGQNLVIRYESYDNSYNNSVDFVFSDITSDFGARRIPSWDWHNGLDLANGNTQVEDHILSITDGLVLKIDGDGYRTITIDGQNKCFSYGHLFQHGATPSTGLSNGDMVLKKMEEPFSEYYAIINTTDGTAIGEVDGASVIYNVPYTVSNYVLQNDPIGIIGNSGTGTTPFPVHIHLYYCKCRSN